MNQSEFQLPLSLRKRLWWGILLPHAISLAAVVAAIFLVGSGREFAPVVGLLFAVGGVPPNLLLGCWVLFVRWHRRRSALLAGLLVPVVFNVIVFRFVYLAGPGRRNSEALLKAWGWLLEAFMSDPKIALPMAAAAAAILIGAAWWFDRRR